MSAWKYDADEHDPLTKLRIPVVHTSSPGWTYEVALCIDPLYRDPPLWPTDAEAAMIASYIEYRTSGYTGWWAAQQQARPFDLGNYATVVLIKWGDNDWCHRLSTWTSGPFWAPAYNNPNRLDLAGLLDRIVNHNGASDLDDWRQWKAAHPDIWTSKETAK